MKFTKGEAVIFASRAGREFKATVFDPVIRQRKMDITLSGDPFPVTVFASQVRKEDEVPTATLGPEGRRLAKAAKLARIKGYQKMTLAQLRKAVADAENGSKPAKAVAKRAPVKKATKAVPRKARPVTKKVTKRTPVPRIDGKKIDMRTKEGRALKARQEKRAGTSTRARKATKAPAKRATKAVKRSTRTPSGPNPFREGSNAWKMTEELLKGGKRADMVRRLKKTMTINPWSKPKEEDPDFAIGKRLLMVSADLEKSWGYTVVSEGRGPSGTLKVIPPKKTRTGQTAKRAASSKKTTTRKRR